MKPAIGVTEIERPSSNLLEWQKEAGMRWFVAYSGDALQAQMAVSRPPRERLLAWIILHSWAAKKPFCVLEQKKGMNYSSPARAKHICHDLGLSADHVSHLLDVLETEGWIKYGKDKLIWLNARPKLGHVPEEKPVAPEASIVNEVVFEAWCERNNPGKLAELKAVAEKWNELRRWRRAEWSQCEAAVRAGEFVLAEPSTNLTGPSTSQVDDLLDGQDHGPRVFINSHPYIERKKEEPAVASAPNTRKEEAGWLAVEEPASQQKPSQKRQKPESKNGHYPLTAAAIQTYFPDAEATTARDLAEKVHAVAPTATDAHIADAVHRNKKHHQKSAGLWLITVPTWFEQWSARVDKRTKTPPAPERPRERDVLDSTPEELAAFIAEHERKQRSAGGAS